MHLLYSINSLFFMFLKWRNKFSVIFVFVSYIANSHRRNELNLIFKYLYPWEVLGTLSFKHYLKHSFFYRVKHMWDTHVENELYIKWYNPPLFHPIKEWVLERVFLAFLPLCSYCYLKSNNQSQKSIFFHFNQLSQKIILLSLFSIA